MSLPATGASAARHVCRRSGLRSEEGRVGRCSGGRAANALFSAVLLLVLATQTSAVMAESNAPPAGGTAATLSVISRDPASPAKQFRVVLVCDTAESRAKGLQGFRRLRMDEAALFEFGAPVEPAFWMGSVPYPIDIAFVDASGTVVRVFAGCRPGSNELYLPGMPVVQVIETAAGAGLRAGDRVIVVRRDARRMR